MIDIEFHPPPGPSKTWWVALGALAMLACATWALAGWSSIERSRVEQAIAAKRVAVAEQQRLTALNAAGAMTPPPYAAAAWEVWQQGRFEASVALSAIEAVAMEGIALQALDVVADQATVKVELIASDHERLNQYLDHLNAGLSAPQWRIGQVAMASGQSNAALRATLIYRYSMR